MKLTDREAAEARHRRLDYEHSLALEGIVLTSEQRERLDQLDAMRMDVGEGVRHILRCARERGDIMDEVMPS